MAPAAPSGRRRTQRRATAGRVSRPGRSTWRLWRRPAPPQVAGVGRSHPRLAGLGLDVLGNDLEFLGLGETLHSRPLRLDAKSRALLLPCGDTIVGNSTVHTKGIPPFALCMNTQSEQ